MSSTRARGDAPEIPSADARPATDLTRTVLATGTLLLLIGGSLYVLRPFVPALIWSTMIVTATWPAMLGIQRRVGGRRAPAVIVLLLVQILVIVVPIYAAVSTLANHAAEVMTFVTGLSNYSLPSPPRWLSRVPLVGARIAREWQTLSDAGAGGVLAKVQPYAALVVRFMLTRVSELGGFLLYLLLTLILCGLLYVKGEVAVRLVSRVAERVAGHNGADIIRLTGQSIRAIALGVVVTALIQASLGSLGIWFAGVPFAGVLAAILLIACLVQIGPLLPLLGCVFWLFANGSRLSAILLLIWTIPVAMVDNVLRPILIRRAVKLPIVLILAGVLGGILSIGVVGLFIGPVILAVTYHLLLAWIEIERPDASPMNSAVSSDVPKSGERLSSTAGEPLSSTKTRTNE
jgi:predicted PurR-regulated permease PerM